MCATVGYVSKGHANFSWGKSGTYTLAHHLQVELRWHGVCNSGGDGTGDDWHEGCTTCGVHYTARPIPVAQLTPASPMPAILSQRTASYCHSVNTECHSVLATFPPVVGFYTPDLSTDYDTLDTLRNGRSWDFSPQGNSPHSATPRNHSSFSLGSLAYALHSTSSRWLVDGAGAWFPARLT